MISLVIFLHHFQVVETDYLNDITELFGEHNNMWKTQQAIQVPLAPYPHLEVTTGPNVLPTTLNTGDQVSLANLLIFQYNW